LNINYFQSILSGNLSLAGNNSSHHQPKKGTDRNVSPNTINSNNKDSQRNIDHGNLNDNINNNTVQAAKLLMMNNQKKKNNVVNTFNTNNNSNNSGMKSNVSYKKINYGSNLESRAKSAINERRK